MRISEPTWKLVASLGIDLVGMGSTVLTPILGISELSDAVWAPVSAAAIMAMYGSVPIAAVGFVEEILPFTDIVPTATLAWVYTYLIKGG